MKKLALAAIFALSIFAIGCKKEEAPMGPADTEQAVTTSTTTAATPADTMPAAPAAK